MVMQLYCVVSSWLLHAELNSLLLIMLSHGKAYHTPCDKSVC